MNPLTAKLREHVTGAIEAGRSDAVIEIRHRQPKTFVSDYYGISANILTLTSEDGACEYQVTVTDLDAEMTLECSKTFPTFLQAVEFARACVR